MFFVLSKVFWFVFQPSSLIALAIIAGLLLMKTRFSRAGVRLIAAGAALLVVLGLSPIGGALILPLEERFPRPALSETDKIDGIIVLGGAEDARVGSMRAVASLNEAAERMTEALVLARRYPVAKLVFTGGAAELFDPKPPEAEAARKFFIDAGLAPERIIIESQSRTTFENAVLTKGMVSPAAGERWLLVTSAFHMPRSMGCFRAAGFNVEPFPVDYRTIGTGELYRPFSSIPEGLRRMDLVMKEYVGLVAYYFSGRTDALFPRP